MTLSATTPPFYTYLREERQFSFLLAHLLMQRGDGLRHFLELLGSAGYECHSSSELDDAEVYVEFAILRDQWFALGPSHRVGPAVWSQSRDEVNDAKRRYIDDLFRAVPSLQSLAVTVKPAKPAEFNAFFMGEPGTRITRDIASPGLWSVQGLAARFGTTPEVFLDLCRIKWSFRIKPDVVIVVPGSMPICIEAKLESGEGAYPSGKDATVVDRVMGEVTCERQFTLQQFLFKTILGQECFPVVIQKNVPSRRSTQTVLTWSQVLAALGAKDSFYDSIPFVRRLVNTNRSLLESGRSARRV